MYVVTRSDLTPGQQATQAVHAAFCFARSFAPVIAQWVDHSNYLVLLSVPSEPDLEALADRAATIGIRHTRFIEPDWDDAMTAVALEPGTAARKLCANLPLALKGVSA